MNEESIYKIIQKANEEQTQRLAKVTEEQTKLLREEIKRNVHEIEVKVEKVVEDLDNIKNKHVALERKHKKNNIIVFGLDNNTIKENFVQHILSQLNTLLEVDIRQTDINNIYCVGKSTKPPIILEFVSYLTKQLIFSKVSKLKGKGVIVANDLCREDREEIKILREHQKRAQAQNLKAIIKKNKLIVGDKIYTAQDLQTLDTEDYSDSEDVLIEASEEKSNNINNQKSTIHSNKHKETSLKSTDKGTNGGRVFTRGKKVGVKK